MATKVLKPRGDEQDRLELVFRMILARRPDEQEQSVLLSALHRTREQFSSDFPAAQALVDVGESTVDHQLDTVELASWTSLCLAVLNLDEAPNPAINHPAINHPAINHPAINHPPIDHPAITTLSTRDCTPRNADHP